MHVVLSDIPIEFVITHVYVPGLYGTMNITITNILIGVTDCKILNDSSVIITGKSLALLKHCTMDGAPLLTSTSRRRENGLVVATIHVEVVRSITGLDNSKVQYI